MAKTHVVDDREHTRIPFLRGILTRSLQDAGLAFEDAYDLASRVRNELDDQNEITSTALRARVVKLLEAEQDKLVLERYRAPFKGSPTTILVESADGQEAPFSRGRHQRFLEACGLGPEVAGPVTTSIYEHLLRTGVTHIPTCRLGYLTYLALKRGPGLWAAEKYLVWSRFTQSGKPLLILIGGTVGCGKSTVATALANRLEIVRSQSTDMLREVMRVVVPQSLVPVLHTSSFNAWRELPFTGDGVDDDPERHIVEGYQSQAELVSVASEAVLNRARTEKVPLILEGVHVSPAFGARLSAATDAVVVPVMLAVLKQKQLRKRIRGRGIKAPRRRAQRYLNEFDAIWRLQSYLLSEADRSEVAIVANNDKQDAVQQVLAEVGNRLKREFSGDPREVFGLPPRRVPGADGESPDTADELDLDAVVAAGDRQAD